MRSKAVRTKPTTPDPVYQDIVITKVINRTMRSGKKTAAAKQVYKALELIGTQTGESPLTVFHAALENIRPQMEVRARRIGGAAYQVPSPVRGPRKDSLAIRWLILAATARPNAQYHSFAEKLAAELVDAKNQAGAAVKKKLDTHRMAEANKAFAHFRW